MAKDAGVMMIDKNSGKEIRKIILADKKDRIINSMNWAVCCIINLMETKYRDLHSDPCSNTGIVKAITSGDGLLLVIQYTGLFIDLAMD